MILCSTTRVRTCPADSASAALDRDSEARVLRTIREISRTRAVLFITHKHDVRQWADAVYALE